MINFFNRKKTNINSIVIPDFGWKKQKVDKSIIQWINAEQTIALSLNFFNLKPDLPLLKEIDVVRAFYRGQISQVNGGLIQVDYSDIKHQAIKTIFKIPQEPSGMVYLASLTVPFKNCSYVIKIQALEIGMTGIRDSIIAEKLMQDRKIDIGENGYKNWFSDPYDSNYSGGTLMNKSEDPIYDLDFENHPLTQVRKLMSQIEKEIEFKPEIEKLKQFIK